jgi:tRNA A-37 threonylcarbamoyl transferase component Bud32
VIKNKKRFLFKISFLFILVPLVSQTQNVGTFDRDHLVHENRRLQSIINRLQAPHARNRFKEMHTGIPEKSVIDVVALGDTIYFQTRNNVYELKDYRVKIFFNRPVKKLFAVPGQGLYYYEEYILFNFFNGKKKKLFNDVSSLYQTRQGDLIFKVNKEKKQGTEFYYLRKNNPVKKLISTFIPKEQSVIAGGDLDDWIFLITKEKIHLYHPASKKLTKKKNEFGILTDSTQEIFYHPEYGYLFSGEKGIIALKNNRFYSFNREQGLDSSYTKVVAVDRKNRTWVVSQTFGLAVKDEPGWRYYDTRDGLTNFFINSVTQWQGTLIFATDNGLFYFNETTWNPLTPPDDLNHDISGVFLSAYQDQETGKLYFGENHGGVVRVSGSLPFPSIEYLTADTRNKLNIYCILKYKNHLLFATNDGIKTLKNDRLVDYEHFPYTFFTYSLFYDPQYHCLFVCSEEGVFYRFDHQAEFVRMKYSNKLIWKIFKEPGDTFWILSVGGLYKAQFKDKKPKFVKKISLKGTKDKDKQYFATAMARFNNQSYLVATNKGVFFLEKDRLTKRGVFKNDIFSLETNHLLKSRNDEWIISTTKGIIRLRDDCFVLQDTDDGLRNNYTSQTIQDQQGNLWAVTDRGIACQALGKPRPISIGAVLNDEWVFFKQKNRAPVHFKITRNKDEGIHYLFGSPVNPIPGPFIPRIDTPEIKLRLYAFSPLLGSDQKACFFIQSGNHHYNIDYNQPKVLTLPIKSFKLSSGPSLIALEYLNPTGPGNHITCRIKLNIVEQIPFLLWVFLVLILFLMSLLFFMIRQRRKQRFIGPFKLNKVIGHGGMGEVWKAYDMNNRHTVALKIIHPYLVNNLEIAERLKREMDFISRIKHKNIVTTFERGIYKDRVYISMEFIDGMSLSDFLEQETVSIAETLVIGATIADALDIIHKEGIIHRDLKPQNILMYTSHISRRSSDYYKRLADSIRITDFGIAKSKYTRTLTGDGMFVGTVYYVSPEQVRGAEIDHRSDIWSLGVILFEMLCKEMPFDSPNLVELLGMIHSSPIKKPSELNPGIDNELEKIILKALKKEVDQRYQDAKSLCADIKDYLKKHFNIHL